jgi:hypothetical protein
MLQQQKRKMSTFKMNAMRKYVVIMVPESKEGCGSNHLLPAPCRSFPFLPSGTGESCACGCPCTTFPRPIKGESCMCLDAKTDGRGAVRSTGVSSCGSMRYGLEEGATSSGPIPLWYGDVGYAGGPRICHFGVVKTVPTLAPTRMPRDGVDAGSNGEISS